MRQVFHRIISAFLTAVFVISAVITNTYTWCSFQAVTNETAATIAQVQLQKLEKLPDGTKTNFPVSGAVFYLYTVDGEQIGGQLITDDAGTISLRLPAGEYYFEEVSPPPGYAFDSENDEQITYYPFSISEKQSGATVVTAYNIRLTGSFAIQKIVQNADGSPLYEEQLSKAFTFTVTFSDSGTYIYRKDDGTVGEISSGGSLTLCHGETALFENIPTGVMYTVAEIAQPDYTVSSVGHQGTVGDTFLSAIFTNTCQTELPPAEPVKLTVQKVLAGEYPAEDLTREFEMTLNINGVITNFTLAAGETAEFELYPGDQYEVLEKDYYKEGYSTSVQNGLGTAGSSDIAVVVTNTFVGTVMTEISGEKIWQGNALTEELLPDSITVYLKDGNRVVAEKIVTPDENGQWFYSFTAPKYDALGNEIAYTVEEQPIEHFRTSYEGFNIINTYIAPASFTFPPIQKTVQGDSPPSERFSFLITAQDNAPMPEGVHNGFLSLSITGSGEIYPGTILYSSPGTYIYTITESPDDLRGWLYDSAVYTVTVTVTETEDGLLADAVISKDGQTVDAIEFVNFYDSQQPPQSMTIVEGQKTWHHGDNPEEQHPESIILKIYGDGALVLQQLITAEDGWKYRFELPKYNQNGDEIIYTIDEVPVEHYEKVIDGYDLYNIYTAPEEPEGPDDPGVIPPTGDSAKPWLWFVVMILSGIMCVLIHIRRKQIS